MTIWIVTLINQSVHNMGTTVFSLHRSECIFDDSAEMVDPLDRDLLGTSSEPSMFGALAGQSPVRADNATAEFVRQ
jgi:hypothetical protein